MPRPVALSGRLLEGVGDDVPRRMIATDFGLDRTRLTGRLPLFLNNSANSTGPSSQPPSSVRQPGQFL